MSNLTNRYPMTGERELFYHALDTISDSRFQHVADELYDIFFSSTDLIPAIKQWTLRHNIVLDCILCGGTEIVQQWELINDIYDAPVDVPCPFCATIRAIDGFEGWLSI